MIEFRNVKLDDAKELLNIYKYYVESTAIAFELSVPIINEFEDRIKNITKNYSYIALLENNK